MKRVFLSLGGNIGAPQTTLCSAAEEIKRLADVYNFKISQYHQTTPVSDIPQPDFINAACQIDTTLSAYELLYELQKIEKKLGKIPKPKNAPRPIDIDIILFGEEQHDTPELQIPHPRWQKRSFVLEPLLELTRYVHIPGNKKLLDVNELLLKINANDYQQL